MRILRCAQQAPSLLALQDQWLTFTPCTPYTSYAGLQQRHRRLLRKAPLNSVAGDDRQLIVATHFTFRYVSHLLLQKEVFFDSCTYTLLHCVQHQPQFTNWIALMLL
jgi:hypothetical protein